MKKSGFLTFILSFVPGCGLMYLGYMKKGLQAMALFAASGFLAFTSIDMFYSEMLMVLFIILLPVIWFYQMFDAMHSLSRMRNLEMELPTDDVFFLPQSFPSFSPSKNPTAAKVLACILIFVGACGLIYGALDYASYIFDHEMVYRIINTIRNYMGPAVVSIALIAAGLKLLKGSGKGKTDVGGSGDGGGE